MDCTTLARYLAPVPGAARPRGLAGHGFQWLVDVVTTTAPIGAAMPNTKRPRRLGAQLT